MLARESGALNYETLLEMLKREPPLVENMTNPADQVQPNGIDLTLDSVASFTGAGRIGLDNAQRELASTMDLELIEGEWTTLGPGPYLITFRETVNMPTNLMALGRPRSSLLRNAVSIHSGVWDAGYSGRSQSLMTVHQRFGFRVQPGAKLLQLVFFTLNQPTGYAYQGRYQHENTGK